MAAASVSVPGHVTGLTQATSPNVPHYYAPMYPGMRFTSTDQYARSFYDNVNTHVHWLWVPAHAWSGPYNGDYDSSCAHQRNLLDMFRAQVVGRPDEGLERQRCGLFACRVPGLEGKGLLYALHFTPTAARNGAEEAQEAAMAELDPDFAAAVEGGEGGGRKKQQVPVERLAPQEWHERLVRNMSDPAFKRLNADFMKAVMKAGDWKRVLVMSPTHYTSFRIQYGGERVRYFHNMTLEVAARVAVEQSEGAITESMFLSHFREEGMRLPRDPENLYTYSSSMLRPDEWACTRRAFEFAPDYLVDDLVANLRRKRRGASVTDAALRQSVLGNLIRDVVLEERNLFQVCEDFGKSRDPPEVVWPHLNALALAPPRGCYGPAVERALRTPLYTTCPLPPPPALSDPLRIELPDASYQAHPTHVTRNGRPLGASYFATFATHVQRHLGMAPKGHAYLVTLIACLAAGLDPTAPPKGLSPARFMALFYGPRGQGKTTLQEFVKTVMPPEALKTSFRTTDAVGTTGNAWEGQLFCADEAGALMGIDADAKAKWDAGVPNTNDEPPARSLEQNFRAWCSGTHLTSTRPINVSGIWGEAHQVSNPPGALFVCMNNTSALQYPPPIVDRSLMVGMYDTSAANAASNAFTTTHMQECDQALDYARLVLAQVWAFNVLRSITERAGVAEPVSLGAMNRLLTHAQEAYNRLCAYPQWNDRRRDTACIVGSVLMRFAHYMRRSSDASAQAQNAPPPPHSPSFDTDRSPIDFATDPESLDITLFAAQFVRFDPVHAAFIAYLRDRIRRVLTPGAPPAAAALASHLDAFRALPASQKHFNAYVQISQLGAIPAANPDDHATRHAYLKKFVESIMLESSHLSTLGHNCIYRLVFEGVHLDTVTSRSKGGPKVSALKIHNGQVYAHMRLLIALTPLEALGSIPDLAPGTGVLTPVAHYPMQCDLWYQNIAIWTAADHQARTALEEEWP